MNTNSNADVSARLEKLESAVARLSKAQVDRARFEQSPDAVATRANRASARSAADGTAPEVRLPLPADAGVFAKIRRVLAVTWETLEAMSG